jgi:chromosome segregation ATPase
LALLPDFLAQRQSKGREAHIRLASMTAAQQTSNYRINALEAGQRELSAQHSAIEAELSEVHESANRTERELSELTTEIRPVSSTSATAREMPCRRADEASRSEIGISRRSAEVEVLQRGFTDTHEKVTAHKDDISKIKTDLKQFKDKGDQQPLLHWVSIR